MIESLRLEIPWKSLWHCKFWTQMQKALRIIIILIIPVIAIANFG